MSSTDSMENFVAEFFRRHIQTILILVVLLGGVLLYTRAVTTNPAGFYFDESSIAYNAHLISQTGRDEHGEAWPLYFRAFGDYKNPVYVYLLALLFRLTGPSILVARLFSAILGVLTAIVLALLATRITRRRTVGLLVMFVALLTPWLFELSRVVVEVALYPAVVALFLLFIFRADEKEKWNWADAICIGASLALITYTYSIGRALGPLLALGLVAFASRARLWSLLKVWLLFGLTLIPLALFHLRHPGALRARYQMITFITPQTSYAEDAIEFLKHFFANINPWKLVVSGDPNGYQIASVYHVGPFLLGALLLLAGTVFMLIRRRQLSAWWCFVLYGLAVSFVPASLTNDYFHILRLAAVPVFLLVLIVPALAWLTEKRGARGNLLLGVLVLIIAQSMFFQWQYHRGATLKRRLDLFDADYNTTILPLAMSASGAQPIYRADTPPIPGYIQTLWYGTLDRIPPEKFILLKPDTGAPDGATVITTEDTCPRCEILYKRWPYIVYVAKGPPRSYGPLPASQFRAEIRPLDCPERFKPKEKVTLRVMVKNLSNVTWFARERSAASYQLNLGNHWLSSTGKTIANDDGRASLLQDLPPGQEAEFRLIINAPRSPGNYILELDMLQENVSWFGLRGSQTARIPIKVE
jgi:4-amino-4-deoxy-L-arabinose transferase-like glycosyltransferase